MDKTIVPAYRLILRLTQRIRSHQITEKHSYYYFTHTKQTDKTLVILTIRYNNRKRNFHEFYIVIQGKF